MKKKLTQVLIMVMLLSMIYVPHGKANAVSSISITENKCFYAGEDRLPESLTVKGLVSDGSEILLTNNPNVSYESSDETVFRFDGSKLFSTGKNGKAVITAEYAGKTAKVLMTRQDAQTPENQPIAPDVNVSGSDNAAYTVTGTPGTANGGHFDGSSLSNWENNWAVRLMRKSWAKGNDPANAGDSIDLKWWDSGYRSFGGWFYDDGDLAHKQGFSWVVFSDSELYHESKNFAEDYGYDQFKEKWAGKKSWKAVHAEPMHGDGASYVNGSAYGGAAKIKSRSKGWHQFVMSLEMNANAEYGWSVYSYLDGSLIGRKDIVPEEGELQSGITDCNSWAAIEIRPEYQEGYKNYMDDMILMGSLESSDELLAPRVLNLSISGVPNVGRKLTADTFIVDPENDELDLPEYKWQSSEDGQTWSDVPGGTGKSYILKAEDTNKLFRVAVTPRSTAEPKIGSEKISETVTIAQSEKYYVALDGNDNNSGTIEAPFATVEKAKEVISKFLIPEGGVTVYIRGGEYYINNTINFYSDASGEDGRPVIYKAYPGEEVSFVGSKDIDTSKIKKVTDEALLSRLIEDNAKDNLYMLNLAEQGITVSPVSSYGSGFNEYNPTEFYMNGMLLTNARWPNNDQSKNLIQAAPVTGDAAAGYNDVRQKYMYTFPDAENRSSGWTIKPGNSYMAGAVVYFWADSSYTIDTFNPDTKVLTTVDKCNISAVPGAGWGQQYRVYFGNIFEEIDKPGEMYIDRETGIMYFYPIGDVQDADMTVSVLDKNMLNFYGTSNITFDGINFKNTRKTPINITKSDKIRIENAEISGSSQRGIDISDTKNSAISGCHFCNISSSAIYMSGGDRANIVHNNNVIENSYFHSTNLRPGDRFAVTIHDAVGETVRHNEFDDLPHGAIDVRKSNDITIEYNSISNALYFDSDMGSIYWGRDNTVLGMVVRYNYFSNFLTDCWAVADGYVDGVFWDDGSAGPQLYGNVFYNAGRTMSSLRANGAEVSNVYNNIVIDDKNLTKYAGYLYGWGTRNYSYIDNGQKTTVKSDIPMTNWLYLMDMRNLMGTTEGSTNPKEGNCNLWDDNRKNLLWSEKWAEYYGKTMWARTLELYSKELYDGAKQFYDARDEYGLLKYLNENVPSGINNMAHDNAFFGTTALTDKTQGTMSSNNYTQKNISAAKSMFADYGKDFTLTEQGLSAIRAAAPEFQNIPFDKIDRTSTIGGHKPSVTIESEIVYGTPVPGNTITAAYDFSDDDNDAEGLSQIYWYVSDTEQGEYKIIENQEGKSLELTDAYADRYVKYKVIPFDCNMLRGETVESKSFKIRSSITADDIVSIDITQNRSFYVGEDRTSAPLTITGILKDGIKADITGLYGIQYSSSDETVFKFENDNLLSTGKTGKAVVSATLGNLETAKMLMVRCDSVTESQKATDILNTGNPYVISGIPGTAEGGHFDGTSLNTLKDPYQYKIRVCSISRTNNNDRWFRDGYRFAAGWFYDDLVSNVGFSTVKLTDSIYLHDSFENDYGYDNFAAVWKGKKSWQINGSIKANADNDCYMTNPDTYGILNKAWAFKKRSKGWHQVAVSLEQNTNAAYGWTLYTYFDGELVGKKDIVPTEDLPNVDWTFELRANYAAPSSYYDDLIMAGI